jgi:predicted NBD/HSP70 family sugar kinase
VVATERWCHADEDADRDQSICRLVHMLGTLTARADKERLRLAPFVGVGCPGVIQASGTIERGGQNLPGGGWEGKEFNLPTRLAEMLEAMSGVRPTVMLHNDAVVQGISEVPEMQDVERWGVLTIGTGLGNARFTNRSFGHTKQP